MIYIDFLKKKANNLYKTNYHRYKVNKYILLLSFFICVGFKPYLLFGQRLCDNCNLISNGELTWIMRPPGPYLSSLQWSYPLPPNQPFRPTVNYYPPWWSSQGHPNADTINFTSPPSNLELRNFKSSVLQYSEGIEQTICPLISSKPYIFSIAAANWTRGVIPSYSYYILDSTYLKVYLIDNLTYGILRLTGTVFPLNISSMQCIDSFAADTNMQRYYVCNFIPNSNWAKIWIYNDTIDGSIPSGISYRESNYAIDDIELIPNFNFAGPDTILCDTTLNITIGDTCTFSNHQMEYKWYLLPDTSVIIDTNKTITVSPDSSSDYLLIRTFLDIPCIGYDTVIVNVTSGPEVDLLPDTGFCAPDTFILTADTNYGATYSWYKKDPITGNWGQTPFAQTQTITITTSGCYMVLVQVSQCIVSDSICVIFYPEINIEPDSLVTCDTTVCYYFDAGAGFTSYTWWKDDTTSSVIGSTDTICVSSPGNYIVKVFDSNGCYKIDTSELVYKIPEIILNGDTLACAGDTIVLNAKTDTSNVIQWYKYDSTGGSWDYDGSSPIKNIILTGYYKLCITDTLGCEACDSLYIRFLSLPTVYAGDIDTCEDAKMITLNHGTPQGGIYTGPYVRGHYYFAPTKPGTYELYYSFEDSITGCPNTYAFEIEIFPVPDPKIEQPGPFCITDSSVYLVAEWDSIVDTFGIFSPADSGAGSYVVTYDTLDSNGCYGSDTITIVVGDTFNVDISISASGCNWYELTATVSGDTGTHTFTWSHEPGKDTSTIRIFKRDTFIVTVSSSNTACKAKDTIIISNLGTNCRRQTNPTISPNYPPGNPVVHYVTKDTLWNNGVIISDVNIFVDKWVTLHILNCEVYMRNCSKIIVERGAKLIIDTSCVGLCKWKGIEVWGVFDECSDADSSQGRVEMNYSYLSKADIGILSGKRDNSMTHGYDPAYNGGVITAKNDTFEMNYVDIMFEDWNVGGICICPDSSDCNGRWFQSEIHYNYFGELRESGKCPNWEYVESRLDYIRDSTTSQYSKPTERCHIIDLTPYEGVSATQQVGGYYWNWCDRTYWLNSSECNHPNYLTPSSEPNATYGNEYHIPCDCKNHEPYNNFD